MQKKLSPIFRVIHWCIAIAVILNAFILLEGDIIHRYLGYSAVILIGLRLIIKNKQSVGHYNPKAKYVYWLIWLCVAALALTGFLLGTDRFFGNSEIEEIHKLISDLIIGLVAIHLIGIFWDAYSNKRKTWMLMISGEKFKSNKS